MSGPRLAIHVWDESHPTRDTHDTHDALDAVGAAQLVSQRSNTMVSPDEIVQAREEVAELEGQQHEHAETRAGVLKALHDEMRRADEMSQSFSSFIFDRERLQVPFFGPRINVQFSLSFPPSLPPSYLFFRVSHFVSFLSSCSSLLLVPVPATSSWK